MIGVLGAGTMGSGIAQLAASRARGRCCTTRSPRRWSGGWSARRTGCGKKPRKGGLSEEQARGGRRAAASRWRTSRRWPTCELVIEAAPERLELKHELYGRLSEIVGAECVLASNTSSLPVTAIAAGGEQPASGSWGCTSSTRRR